jgi:predicted transcriptional regulator
MEYDLEDPAIQFQLTKICQVIANQNSRRMLEILAVAPMTIGDLQERIDLRDDQLKSAAKMMISLGLVQKSGGPRKSTGAEKQSVVTYKLADGGLRLVRFWLDHIFFISAGEGHGNR